MRDDDKHKTRDERATEPMDAGWLSFAILHKTCITLFNFSIWYLQVHCCLSAPQEDEACSGSRSRALKTNWSESSLHQTIFLQNERFPSLVKMPCNFFQMNTRPPTSPKTSWSGAWCWARSELLWRPTPSSTSSTTTATPSSSRTGFHPSSPRPWREVQSWIFLCKRCLDWWNFWEIG